MTSGMSEKVFKLYTMSRCELSPLWFTIILLMEKEQEKAAVIMISALWIKAEYSEPKKDKKKMFIST